MSTVERMVPSGSLPERPWAVVLPAVRPGSEVAVRRVIASMAGLVPPSRTVLVLAAGQGRRPSGNVPADNVVWHRPDLPVVTAVLAGLLRVHVLCGAPADLFVMRADPGLAPGLDWRFALGSALAAARRSRRLVLIGVQPQCPPAGRAWIVPAGTGCRRPRAVLRFLESVDASTAARLFEEGALVNSHSFAVSADVLLSICAGALEHTTSACDFSTGVLAGSPKVAVLAIPESARAVTHQPGRLLREMN